jgi:hypothetical protein
MAELVTWLTRGEIHEYLLRNCQLTCDGEELRLTADLWPAYLGYAPEPNPAAVLALLTALADPTVLSFFVHLRMPRRFALIFELDESAPVDHLVLHVADTPGEKSGEEITEEDKRIIRFFQDDALADDPSEGSLVVQLT